MRNRLSIFFACMQEMKCILGLPATLYILFCHCPPGHPGEDFISTHTFSDATPSPTASPTAPAPDSAPQQLSEDQCSLGANSSLLPLANEVALPGKLYVEFGAMAPCSGLLIGWEICFTRSGLLESEMDFVVLRLDQNRRGYMIVSVHELIMQRQLGETVPDGGIQCVYITDTDEDIHMVEGDVLGFVTSDNLRVTLAELPRGTMSTLRIFEFGPARGGPEQDPGRLTGLQVNDVIQQERFVASAQQVTSLIRIILSEGGGP